MNGWKVMYALGVMYSWEKEGSTLNVTKRGVWEVEVNHKPIGSSPDLNTAKKIALDYMSTH